MATLVKVHPDGREEFKEGGARVEAIEYHKDGLYKGVKGHQPIVGCSLLVGSVAARSYSDSDYWITTTVTEIIETTDEHILFKTENSTYKLLA